MVPCPMCGQDVDWVTVKGAAKVLGVSEAHVRVFIRENRLPGANKHDPGNGMRPLWRIPIVAVIALKQAREER